MGIYGEAGYLYWGGACGSWVFMRRLGFSVEVGLVDLGID